MIDPCMYVKSLSSGVNVIVRLKVNNYKYPIENSIGYFSIQKEETNYGKKLYRSIWRNRV